MKEIPMKCRDEDFRKGKLLINKSAGKFAIFSVCHHDPGCGPPFYSIL